MNGSVTGARWLSIASRFLIFVSYLVALLINPHVFTACVCCQVKADRDELARIVRLCKVDPRHVGWMQDAMDKNKCGLPTTESQAKCLGKMHRIKSKITGVQLFKDDGLIFFRTLPDVPTGGNLTLTIIAHMFNRDDVRQATDVYINVDGASDNICYHFVYGLAHLLRCAVGAAWPLRCIHILRFKVCTCPIAPTSASTTNACNSPPSYLS